MNETENTFLKTEIARLNKIIEALLSYNEVLRKNSSLPGNGNASPKSGFSINEKGNGTEEVFGSTNEKGNGTEEVFGRINEKDNGTEEFSYSII